VTRFFKPHFILAAALFCLTVPARPAAAQNKPAAGLFPDPVVATGKGFEIRRSAVQEAFIAEKSLRGMAIPESLRPRMESDILRHIVIDKIMTQKATADEKARVREEVAQRFEEVRKSVPSEQLFEQQVKASGKSLDQLKDDYVEKELAQVVLVRELAPSNALSDDAIKKFYDDEENATNFTVQERVHVAQILISELDPATQQTLPPAQRREKEKLARDIRDRAEKGEDFAALAKQYSDDKSTREEGGEVSFARHSMPFTFEGFEAACFSLRTNQISDLVESPAGYHIIKLLEKLPASKVPLDNKVAAEIRKYLANQEINKGLPAYVPKIEAEYKVKITLPDYSPTALIPPAAPASVPGSNKK
jgi:foldase protein PrsA